MSLFDRVKSWIGAEPSLPPPPAPRVGPPPTADELLEALRVVFDPEIGIDVVSMGLVRGVEVIDGEGRVNMTLSTEGCPVGPLILREVEDVVRQQGLVARVELGFDPPWSPADIEPGARAGLGRR